MPTPPAALILKTPRLDLEYGESLAEVEIAYEVWGTLDDTRSNAIMVCPAFSAHCHARSTAGDETPGWWENMIGPGRALDTDRFFVVCASLLGSCYGTTGPTSPRDATGRIWAGDFPLISIRDIVNAHVRLLDHLGIETAHAVIGGSMGAMQALELAVENPARAGRVIAISGTAQTRPYTTAIRHFGRRAIMADPAWKGGSYGETPPVEGLRLAREVGTLFYRSREEFNDRFAWTPIARPKKHGIIFDVQSYLDYQGRKFVGHFDANAYLTLSLAMDLHDLGRDHESLHDALARTQARFLIAGVEEDRLVPIDEQRHVHEELVAAGRESHWRSISSRVGHDAFLVETDLFTPIIKDFVEND